LEGEMRTGKYRFSAVSLDAQEYQDRGQETRVEQMYVRDIF